MIDSTELRTIAYKGFAVGDQVTVRSITAKSMLLGVPAIIQVANYPSLIGVVLTIESINEPWIICTRASGSYAPGLTVEDLEMWGNNYV